MNPQQRKPAPRSVHRMPLPAVHPQAGGEPKCPSGCGVSAVSAGSGGGPGLLGSTAVLAGHGPNKAGLGWVRQGLWGTALPVKGS